MTALEKVSTGIRTSRRNIIKMGAVAASAVFAGLTEIRSAAAQTNGDNGKGNNGTDNGNHGNGDNGKGNGGDPPGQANCFLKGTTIRTADGDRKIEDLAVNDLLPTVFGGIRPIQWIGHYSFRKSDPTKAWVKDVLPVRVARSALGPDVPHADLYLTKWHSLLLDGVLVTAGSLINGITITLYDARELNEMEFFHIKLARHDVIYAEGAPCETLIRVEENAVNFAEYFRHYGSLRSKEAPCAPLLNCFGGRNQIKSRFRSAISPWIERRQKVDIIRDKLEERGIAILRDRNSSRDCRVFV